MRSSVAAGLNPLTDQSPVIQVVAESPGSFDLYTEDSIMDLRMGGLMLRPTEGGSLTLEFDILESEDLQQWNLLERMTRQIDMPQDRSFLQVRASEGGGND